MSGANRNAYPVMSHKSDIKIVYDKIVGNTSSNPTLPNASNMGSFITAATHSSTGTFALTFRWTYPELKLPEISISGTTAGLKGRFSAIDVTAGTATLVTEVAGSATDPATTDTIYIALHCRNSGKNK